jgi:hypothetical protein
MRRTLLPLIALFTFALGTTLASLHLRILNILSEPAEIAISPLDTSESVTPLRIGIFIGVDGATLSADGKKFGFYEDYFDREVFVPISPAELRDVVHQLRSAGLFEEAEFNSPFFVSLPQTFSIVVAWADEQRRFSWIPGDECRVPEKYLQILERLNRTLKHRLIQDFIAHNRHRVSSEMKGWGCFSQ